VRPKFGQRGWVTKSARSSADRQGPAFTFNDPQIDANHDEVIDLLAGPPTRVVVRPVFSGFSS